jgi:hypothetical protein
MQDAIAVTEWIRRKFEGLVPIMDERLRRQWAASEARSLAWGGVSLVAAATGMSRTTIRAGINELAERERTGSKPGAGVRRQGGGGKPLVRHDLIVKLIGNTTTATGLKVKAALDTDRYESGIKVSDDELAAVHIQRDEFHGEWNYSILPKAKIG